MAQYDDLDNKQIFAYSAIFVVSTIITILFVSFIFHWMQEGEHERKMFNTEYTQYNKILDEQSAALNEYVVVDPMTDRFGIPIDQVIKAMVQTKKEDNGADSDET